MGAFDAHFEASIALSGAIAPKLYIHLRKAQREDMDRQRANISILTGMGLYDRTDSEYLPLRSRDNRESEDLHGGHSIE